MPYQIIEREGQYCVAKEGEDAPIEGGCHPTRAEAEAQMAALYAGEQGADSKAVLGPDPMIYFGDAVKALGDGRVGGYLVRFSSPQDPDLVGDFFTPQTDFGKFTETDILYQHGLDRKIGPRVMGTGRLKQDEVGVWVEGQLALRDDYERAVYQMAEAGKLGWSSGTANHLVEREPEGRAHRIKRWPLGLDASLTPTPAEPRNQAISLKTLRSGMPGQAAPDGAPAEIGSITTTTAQPEGITTMPDEIKAQLEAQGEQLKGLSAALEKLMKQMEQEPAIRNSGHFSVDGGRADPAIKSFGDFLLAIRRGDAVRLKTIYNSVKDMSSETGTAGGYLVPTEFNTQLLQIAAQASYLLGGGGVQQFPVTAPAGTWPALDQFAAPTPGSGNTASAGRVTASKRAQGGAYGETQPQFEQIKYLVNDAASGAVQAPKELRVDSAVSIEALLRTLIGIALKSKLEYYILRGNGVGEPLGILNAPALVNVAPDNDNTFAFADAVEMVSRHKNVSGRPSIWVQHPGNIVDVAAFQVATSSPATLVTNLGGPLPRQLLGYGLVDSEHLPQNNNSGHVILIDPGAYALFVLGTMYIDFSEHVAFLNGLDTWRFGQRCDGQPWWKGVQTLADPQGNFTVSPFVNFND